MLTRKKALHGLIAILIFLLAIICLTCYLNENSRSEKNENNHWEKSEKIVLTSYDVLAKPGESTTLKLKVERPLLKGIYPDVHYIQANFFLGDTLLGTAITGREGYALLNWKAPETAGDLTITCVVKNVMTQLYVYIRSQDERFLVTDIDHTISDCPEHLIPFKDNRDIPALPDAPDVLTHLSKKYSVIYLSARDDGLLNKTREWLKFRGLPKGPVFHRDLKLSTLSAADYKIHTLQSLKEKWSGICVGVSERNKDVKIYAAQKLRAYQITTEADQDPHDRIIHVRGWNEIESLER